MTNIKLNSGNRSNPVANTTKMIGYIPTYRTLEQINTAVDFNQFSHVNYFSLEPLSDGSLRYASGGSDPHLQSVRNLAHAANTKVLIAIGGWGLSGGFSGATSPANINTFVSNIINFMNTHSLDGVDIDWEYPSPTDADNFVLLMQNLRAVLPVDKSLSVCVPSGVDASGAVSGQWDQLYPSAGLNLADWINIMAYDAAIYPAYPHHSPVELAANALNYWDSVLNPGQNDMAKLVVGVPFYARSEWNSLTYGQIAAVNPNAINTDIYNDGTGNYYYNGGPTLTTKVNTELAMGAGGVMVWEPTQDAPITNPSMRLANVMIQAITDNGYVLDKEPVAEATT